MEVCRFNGRWNGPTGPFLDGAKHKSVRADGGWLESTSCVTTAESQVLKFVCKDWSFRTITS